MLRAELWDPLLDAAFANNELPRGLARADIHLCIGDVTIMVMCAVSRMVTATSSATGPSCVASSRPPSPAQTRK
jgi:hypothetical protein